MFKYLYDYKTMVSIALVSSTMVIKVILIHTTCMNGEADYCHLVSMYAYMHLAFKELIKMYLEYQSHSEYCQSYKFGAVREVRSAVIIPRLLILVLAMSTPSSVQ